ncbi:uncharacterized protein LOC122332938 [Puntigrus tetrazona]|uniref:uncharacterized protein LOC122332938 n=1 Tax=Puntigrus tetrazona TaxID=1606681 RepID=UPI001C88E4F9|nr:uncharacterized protein LOC122332938 [Puntigrus tetrazona]
MVLDHLWCFATEELLNNLSDLSQGVESSPGSQASAPSVEDAMTGLRRSSNPDPSFCLHNHPGSSLLCPPIPVSCLRSPTSQPGLIGLLLQLDSIPYFWCPQPGSGVPTTTCTGDFMATALDDRVDQRGREHSPLGLNVSSLPWDPVKVLPETGVEDLPNRGLCQMFPTDPHPHAWACQVCLAYSPANGYNSPPGGDQLTVPSLSLPECP